MRKSRILKDDRGAELVEFALLAVAFFMFLFGTLEFGRMLWQDNVVANGARDGARWAAVRGASSTTPATGASVTSYVLTRTYGMDVTVTTTWTPATKVAGSVVEVVVERTFTPIVNILPQNVVTLRSTAQMVIAR